MADAAVMDADTDSDAGRRAHTEDPRDPRDTEQMHQVSADALSKPPPRKRRRIVISCTECHRRKQRCDRKLPCTNCTQRGKEASCRYETGTPVGPRKSASRAGRDRTPEGLEGVPTKAADFGYSNIANNGASTLGFLRRIEVAGEPMANVAAEAQEADHSGSRDRYKNLVRQLPPRPFVEGLVHIYFINFNWQYFGLDEVIFKECLLEWYNLPFHLQTTTAGPQAIEPLLRSYPALLFQVLATALLGIPNEDDETFASLKYGSMTFEDLAMDYSETGVTLLSVLGKRGMTISTVLAGWCRAAFLKYTGQVTEAWHQVGTTIRDAQEIGLHRDSFDPQPDKGDPIETQLEKQWSAQNRRRIWMVLVGWDLHTGAVLGRPTTIDIRTLNRSLPEDAPIPRDRKKDPIYPRSERDPPTPLTRAIWAYKIQRPLRDILELEKEGSNLKDFSKVEKLHQELLTQEERTPPPFRAHNPDTSFDHLPECWWLPTVRRTIPQLIAFNFMALHRPYIFTRAESRKEALKASLDMLEAQRIQFKELKPQQYKTFSLFFGTFDALVMMASIYIVCPKENPELLDSGLQHFTWGVERFEAMATRNRLAKAALGVLHAVWIRLEKAVSQGAQGRGSLVSPPAVKREKGAARGAGQGSEIKMGAAEYGVDPQTPGSGFSPSNNPSADSVPEPSMMMPHPDAGLVMTCPGSGMAPTAPPAVSGHANMYGQNLEWTLPAGFDFSTLRPMYPTSDLAYNCVSGTPEGAFQTTGAGWAPPGDMRLSVDPSLGGAGGADADGAGTGWQFDENFGAGTIWGLFNQLPY